jgi:hypothetical protein
VLVLPITHTPPDHPALAVEFPAKVKDRLQLDDARSWVVLFECNEFVWPGPDPRRLPGATALAFAALVITLQGLPRRRCRRSLRNSITKGSLHRAP